MTIRRVVRDDDSAALIALIASCWAEYPGMVMDVDREEPWLRAPATAYARSGGVMWVVTIGRELAGCVGLGPATSTAPSVVHLKSLYVAAFARRRGLGARLARLVEDEARRRGAARVELWSDTRFTDAHGLYRRLGYAQLPQTRELPDLSRTVEYHFGKDLWPPKG